MKLKEEKVDKVNVFGKYQVYIGAGLLDRLSEIIDLDDFSKIIVITDEKIPDKFLPMFDKIAIPSGEENKNIETVQKIWTEMLKLGVDRKSLVINLGGGVIGDMGGFAASCFMRGVQFLQVPTTLLSAVDASVGGKVGVDFFGIKNLIGSFNQPTGVIVDIDTFASLADREFTSGFGEIIKHGVIADPDYFNQVSSKSPRQFSKDELIAIIKKSCEIKAEIISSDEKESGNRKLLNFGHTIGHALESSSLQTEYPLLHGEAVSIGMAAEAKISEELGLIDHAVVLKIQGALQGAGLPINYEVKNPQKIIDLISKDKKSEGGDVKWTLIVNLGQAIFDQKIEKDTVMSALKYISA